MAKTLLYALFWRPVMRLYVALMLASYSALPRPRGRGVAHAPGENRLSILLLGGGAAVGWGVASHDLSLPGQLARALSTDLGRGVDVDVVAHPRMTASAALDSLAELNLSRYDVVLLTLGGYEATELAPVREWRRQFDELVGEIERRLGPAARIVSSTVPDSVPEIGLGAPFARSANRRAAELNFTMLELRAKHPTLTIAPFTLADTSAGFDTHAMTATYRGWAEQFLQPIERVVTTAMSNQTNDPSELDEERRQRALDELGILDTGPDPEIDRILALAQKLFGTPSASVNFLDRDRQWHKASRGVDVSEAPRERAFCNHTILGDEIFVVPNAAVDPRFADHPSVVGEPYLRFYAGYPIETIDGEKVGSLCVWGPEPRLASKIDRIMLRSFALMVQDEIWAKYPSVREPRLTRTTA